MIHEWANEGKVTSAEWHQFRAMARRTAFSPEEFSAPERTQYNLDNDDRLSPAGVTGEDNPDNYGREDTSFEPFERPSDSRDVPWR